MPQRLAVDNERNQYAASELREGSETLSIRPVGQEPAPFPPLLGAGFYSVLLMEPGAVFEVVILTGSRP